MNTTITTKLNIPPSLPPISNHKSNLFFPSTNPLKITSHHITLQVLQKKKKEKKNCNYSSIYPSDFMQLYFCFESHLGIECNAMQNSYHHANQASHVMPCHACNPIQARSSTSKKAPSPTLKHAIKKTLQNRKEQTRQHDDDHEKD